MGAKVGKGKGNHSSLHKVSKVFEHLLLLELGEIQVGLRSLVTNAVNRVIFVSIAHSFRVLSLNVHSRVLVSVVVGLATLRGIVCKRVEHVVSPVQFSSRGQGKGFVSSRGVHMVRHSRLCRFRGESTTSLQVFLHLHLILLILQRFQS